MPIPTRERVEHIAGTFQLLISLENALPTKRTIRLLTICLMVGAIGWTSKTTFAEAGAGGRVVMLVEGPEGTIFYSRPFKNDEQFETAQHGLVTTSLTLAAFGLVKQQVDVIRDPSIAYNLEFANTTTESQSYIATVQFPINPLGANTISAELLVDLIDANSDGQVSLMGDAGGTDAIQTVTVSGTNIGLPLGMDLSTAGMHSFVLDPISGPTPAGTELAVRTNFLLSPGDTARITSRFIIDEGTGIPTAQIQPLPDSAEGPFFNVIDVDSPETSLGNNFQIGAQTQVNLREGGSIGTVFSAGHDLFLTPDIEVNVSGGTLGNDFRAWNESVVNISGGTTGSVRLFDNSTANVSGGNVGDIQVASGVANFSGGATGGFRISGGTLNISGGTVGGFFGVRAEGGTTTISGGTFNSSTAIQPDGGDINIAGGTFDSVCGLCAGTVGAGSVVTVSGGAFTGFSYGLSAGSGTETVFNVYGGTFSPHIDVRNDNELHFFGTEFFLDGVPIDGLEYGEAFEIAGRDVTLTGLLADGSPLSFELNSASVPGEDHMGTDALLTVTLILPGDYNDDGAVDAADYVVWRNNVGGDTALKNDITPWEVGPGDYALWKANFGNTAGNGAGALADGAHAAVPEPAILVLLTFSAVGWCLSRPPCRLNISATCRRARHANNPPILKLAASRD